jgi:hypothetical protein
MRPIAVALIFSFVTLGAGGVSAQQSEAAAWRQVAEAIPLGSKVKVQTLENKRISGTLMRVDGTALMVKRNTRRPEPAVTINFAEVGKIERDSGGGVNIGKAIAIGVATGAGVILSLFLIALQLD